MFYNGETIYNTESMLSKGVHEHDDDERRCTSESKGDTRRVILYTPKFVGKESKLKALENIFGKMIYFMFLKSTRRSVSTTWCL